MNDLTSKLQSSLMHSYENKKKGKGKDLVNDIILITK